MRNVPTFKTLTLVSLTLTALIGCDSKSAGTPPAHDLPPADPLPAVIHGHRLPPEPDPKVNNATLLGVDVNHNEVRDDVERWIYVTYKDKHPIYIDIAMQAARGYKLVLEHPEKAKEIYPEVDKAADCEAYYKFDADELNDKILVHKTIDDKNFRHNIYFNTKERMKTYLIYDTLLSGDTYVLPSPEKEKAACDFNISKYEKEQR